MTAEGSGLVDEVLRGGCGTFHGSSCATLRGAGARPLPGTCSCRSRRERPTVFSPRRARGEGVGRAGAPGPRSAGPERPTSATMTCGASAAPDRARRRAGQRPYDPQQSPPGHEQGFAAPQHPLGDPQQPGRDHDGDQMSGQLDPGRRPRDRRMLHGTGQPQDSAPPLPSRSTHTRRGIREVVSELRRGQGGNELGIRPPVAEGRTAHDKADRVVGREYPQRADALAPGRPLRERRRPTTGPALARAGPRPGSLHAICPPVQVAPGSGVCLPCTYFVRNC